MISRLEPEPEVYAHTAMKPDQNQGKGLQPGKIGQVLPHHKHAIGITVVDIVEFVSNPGTQYMLNKYQRNKQTNSQLNDFPPF